LSTNLASESRGDLTPLTDRLSLLLVVRCFMAATVLFVDLILPDLQLDENALNIARLYIAISIGVELMHRFLSRITKRRWLIFINLMLLVDGGFVAGILAYSGDARSTFIFLAYAHIVSVTLLVGFRTGLKMALWQSMLLLSVYYLGLAEVIPGAGENATSGERKLASQLEVAQAVALWIVAIATATFASLNEREVRRRKGELTIIADLSAEIEQTRRPSEILGALVDTAVSKLQADSAVALCAHGGSIIVAGGHENASAVPGDSLIALGGIVEKAFITGHPVLVKGFDSENDTTLANLLPNASNISAIPLVAEGECVGVLVTSWGASNKRRVTQPMIDLMSNVAGRVALSLSNTFLLAEVQRLASVDGLTGLPNRRTFNQAIEREVARAKRNGQPVSLLMLDIDHFKLVNDQHGHQMGDTVLAESAAGVMEACRGEDLPARYGGEEIVVIMPNCSADQALEAADRIRRALGDANVALPGTHASGGVATFPNNADDVAGLLAAADEALYQSKENGRDRCTISARVGTLTLNTNVHTS
jgi:two-component system cell cycle response regulator